VLSGVLSSGKSHEFQGDDIQRKTGIIAIVDDDEPFREALGSVMRAAGFLTDTFASAEDYLYSAKRQDTMCLILDVRLPGMSGIELQRQLRNANSQVPIIFITAHGDASLRDLAMKAGAAGFLNKPVRSDTLLKEIHAALENTARDRHPR
jgi:FixJ family two-component response regulator